MAAGPCSVLKAASCPVAESDPLSVNGVLKPYSRRLLANGRYVFLLPFKDFDKDVAREGIIMLKNCVPARTMFVVTSLVLAGWTAKMTAGQGNVPARRAEADRVAVTANDLGGVVSGANGPEEGVWVIAETNDLPKANYKIWVRGYGLIDSKPIESVPGKKLALTAMRAPDARTAAQVYPANYWYSLLQIPPKSDFPMLKPGVSSAPRRGRAQNGQASVLSGEIHNQAEWLFAMRTCTQCHQLGDKYTREIEPSLGTFDSTAAAWDRRLKSGQRGPQMATALNQLPRERALAMLSDWSDRIAAGALPPIPPRPQGIERNVVLTEWEWGRGPADWVHDEMTTDKRNPTVNPHGLVYATSEGAGTLVIANPLTNESNQIMIPTRADQKTIEPYLMSLEVGFPSPYFGEQVIWTATNSPHNPMMDQRGRVWVTSSIRGKTDPAYCKEGSNNVFAKNDPLDESIRQLSFYDPETKKWTLIDTCFGTHHLQFAEDKDNTLYFSGEEGAVGWVNTRLFEETGDEQAAQRWCPAYLDTRGDGKFDWKTDKTVGGFPYGLAVNPVDGSAWYSAVGVPGKLVRVDRGSNPPGTCRTEVYEPPYENPNAAENLGFFPHGVDIDSNGIVWTSLAGSGHLASFDRRKCAIRSGPNATGQHCPEGWTLYHLPGPLLKGTDVGSADYPYYNWVDRFDTLGLGKNIPVATGTNSDSLLVLQPDTGKWVVLRVPYPLGFYARGLDGRIDDPKAGWKGRGLWSNFSEIPVWHIEGGKTAVSILLHFQLRPDPLAH